MEPKIVGREQDSRDRKRECVRDRALLKMRDGVGNKFDHWRKELWQMWEVNLRQLMIFSQDQNIFSVNLLMTFRPTDKSQILYNTSQYTEVNCTEPYPSVRVPWFLSTFSYRQTVMIIVLLLIMLLFEI
jgi:hypothetical protein